MNEKMLLWFTTVVALAIGAGSVAKAADDPRFGIVERVQLDQAGGAQGLAGLWGFVSIRLQLC